jgi:glycerol uptake facilitator protein
MKISAQVAGEFVGTFILVFLGCGTVAAAVLTGAQVGIFQVAIVWGVAVAAAIHLTGGLSGAHLNPAVTLCFAVWRGFPWRQLPVYWAAQVAGAFVAAAAVHAMFGGVLEAFEASHGVVRGAAGSEASAMIFGEYFPNPGGHALTEAARATVSLPRAMVVEILGTGLLALVVCGATDERNPARPREFTAALLGLTVMAIVSVVGPLTMAALNPARDLGPRLWSALGGGWGMLPFTANGQGWWLVYLIAPCLGGVMGGAVWRALLVPGYRAAAVAADENRERRG